MASAYFLLSFNNLIIATSEYLFMVSVQELLEMEVGKTGKVEKLAGSFVWEFPFGIDIGVITGGKLGVDDEVVQDLESVNRVSSFSIMKYLNPLSRVNYAHRLSKKFSTSSLEK